MKCPDLTAHLRTHRRGMIACVTLLALVGAAAPALALCCCSDHGEPAASTAEVMPEQPHCHGEPASENTPRLSAEQSACICSAGHEPAEHTPVAAAHAHGAGLSLVGPVSSPVWQVPAAQRVGAVASAPFAASPPPLHIVHCSFLI